MTLTAWSWLVFCMSVKMFIWHVSIHFQRSCRFWPPVKHTAWVEAQCPPMTRALSQGPLGLVGIWFSCLQSHSSVIDNLFCENPLTAERLSEVQQWRVNGNHVLAEFEADPLHQCLSMGSLKVIQGTRRAEHVFLRIVGISQQWWIRINNEVITWVLRTRDTADHDAANRFMPFPFRNHLRTAQSNGPPSRAGCAVLSDRIACKICWDGRNPVDRW